MEGFRSPWPYLSKAEEHLSSISAGEHWPWKSDMSQRIQVPWPQGRVPLGFDVEA